MLRYVTYVFSFAVVVFMFLHPWWSLSDLSNLSDIKYNIEDVANEISKLSKEVSKLREEIYKHNANADDDGR